MRTLLEMAKPMAAEAKPALGVEQAITTGISAEPIGSTSKTPKTKEMTAGKRGALHRVEKSKR